MNQGGGNTGAVTQFEVNSFENSQMMETTQGVSSVYSSSNLGHPTQPATGGSNYMPWTMQYSDNSSSFHHGQPTELPARDAQGDANGGTYSALSTSTGAANGAQQYATYVTYSNSTDPYGYASSGYQDHYNGYQQQTGNSYTQQVGGYQNSGAPYQPLTSFPNSGSNAGSTSYSSTYYNNGDYQTTGGYPSSSYSNQPNWWNDGSYANYSSHQYSSYPSSDLQGAQGSRAVAGDTISYEQYTKQWEDYNKRSTFDVSCAPGTENIAVNSAPTSDRQIPDGIGGHPVSDSQPPPPGTTSWKQESKSSEMPSLQVGDASGITRNGYWKVGFQNQHVMQTPSQTPLYSQTPSYSQTPLYSPTSSISQKSSDTFPVPPNNPSVLQTTSHPQGPNLPYPATYHASQNSQPPLQAGPSFDPRGVSKLQIPTNPRIANLSLGVPKANKDVSASNAATKPTYFSASVTQSDSNSSPLGATDSSIKQGSFPPSLHGYVERALSRCKSDSQKVACQNMMKEIITKALTDGTLHSRDWDTEPLFQLPEIDTVQKNILSPSVVSSLSTYKKNPNRRVKSRWEPLPEEKLVSANHVSSKDISWHHTEETERAVLGGKKEIKENIWTNSQVQRQIQTKNFQRPVKKQRFTDNFNSAESGNASSDSDKEQSLTAYSAAAIALANSPEERKKRENRFKRFDKSHSDRIENKNFRPKVTGGGNLYNKRANALAISRSVEDGGSRAVEDIDWDSLTVRGTCQEIEKRYLRLTSAPDPSTVRPEEVLEKALLMVQGSQKNYLYKCDQLKSIRQDLTVQRIRNELTVKVYETHARLALEAGDLPEFNQCQSQLKILYAEGIEGCQMEFTAYNLLCVILHSSNNRDLVSSMARLSVETKKDETIKHALAVRAAVTSGNYVSYFKLYKTAPYLSTCLMDLYVEKMRFNAVKCISRSYRPTVPVAFVALSLGFTSSSPPIEANDEKDSDGLEECEEWLKAHGACLNLDNGEMMVDTKASSSSLYMPEPEDAVAHGDSNLAVNDFFTRTS